MLKLIFFIAFLGVAASRTVSDTSVKAYYQDTVVEKVLRHAPRNARLIDYRSTGPITTDRLIASLIDNSTLIRENIIGGFDCTGRVYGYYADPANDCQIFHLCVNLKQLFPDNFQDNDFMDFSFICPKYTIFTQDAMVCAWERSAIPCEVAPQLYYLNNNFFVIPPQDIEKIQPEAESPQPEGLLRETTN